MADSFTRFSKGRTEDSEEEVFWGPITAKEEEIRKTLPRKTMEPKDFPSVSKLGASFTEDDRGSDPHQNDITPRNFSREKEFRERESMESGSEFGSCNSSLNTSAQSYYTSGNVLDDTLERIEKMLALADQLENEQNGLPEPTTAVIAVKMEMEAETELSRDSDVRFCGAAFEVDLAVEREPVDILQVTDDQDELILEDPLLDQENKEPERTCVSTELATVASETRLCDSWVPPPETKLEAAPGTAGRNSPFPSMIVVSDSCVKAPLTPTKSCKAASSHSTLKKHLKSSIASPVGMYIHSQPEPVLIQNVKTTPRKLKVPSTAKNTLDYWAAQEVNENVPVCQEIVLPSVLHRAPAAAMVCPPENKSTTPDPWSRGKIGKLLSKTPQPVVLEHQGRIKIPKAQAEKSPLVMKTTRPNSSTSRDSEDGLMEISVLEPTFAASGTQQQPLGSSKRRLNMF